MRPIPTEPMLEQCATCAKETRHEPDALGAYSCVDCAAQERRAANKASGRVGLMIAIGILGAALLFYVAKWLDGR